MLYILWGLKPIMSELVGKPLLPTYDYLRIYREGDVCRVHSDRYSCEHSLSLTLDYSDDKVWPLEVERARTDPSSKVDETFGPQDHASISMQIGDAVMYQGVNHRHGRVNPNPNRWSAHMGSSRPVPSGGAGLEGMQVQPFVPARSCVMGIPSFSGQSMMVALAELAGGSACIAC